MLREGVGLPTTAITHDTTTAYRGVPVERKGPFVHRSVVENKLNLQTQVLRFTHYRLYEIWGKISMGRKSRQKSLCIESGLRLQVVGTTLY